MAQMLAEEEGHCPTQPVRRSPWQSDRPPAGSFQF